MEKYIPENMEECFEELNKILTNNEIKEFKTKKEEDTIVKYHNGLGRYIRNKWGLWNDSVLCNWFKNLGIYHADDMSSIIILSFWRHLNKKPICIDDQVKDYINFNVRENEKNI